MKIRGLVDSFKYAMNGIMYSIISQRNMKIHLLVATFVGVMAWNIPLTKEEGLILLFTVVLVLVAEMFNTAVEAIVDLLSPKFHPLAKIAKDVAAGAVLITVLASLVVGYVLFFFRFFR